MKRMVRNCALFAWAAGLSLTLACCGRGTTTNYYDETLDPEVQLAEALEEAQASGRNVCIQIGGDWCRWCRMFHEFVFTDKELSRVVRRDFIYVHMFCGSDRERVEDIFERLGHPEQYGFPVLVVLSPKGDVLHIQDTAVLEEGEGYNREKVLAFFSQWSRANDEK